MTHEKLAIQREEIRLEESVRRPRPPVAVASSGKRIRFDRGELGGACGDLGTFIPLTVGMAAECGLDLGTALFFAGLMNFGTGLLFGLPVPVQPMKAIAAIAIADQMPVSQIVAAGLWTGTLVLLLGVFGLTERLILAIPRSVVRGLQLVVGLKLLSSGLGMVGKPGSVWDPGSVLLGASCFVLTLRFYGSRRVPAALLVFLIGLSAMAVVQTGIWSQLRLGWAGPRWRQLTLADLEAGFWKGAVPQISLTLLNSVIAFCVLVSDLFPGRSLTTRKAAVSVGLMNLVSCPFGGMPVCHGAGGLAGQYAFGARTGGSMVILGAIKMVLAVLFGSSMLVLLDNYPESVLGVLLVFAGAELALVCRDQRERKDWFVMLLTAGACASVGMAAGVLTGCFTGILVGRGVFNLEPSKE